MKKASLLVFILLLFSTTLFVDSVNSEPFDADELTLGPSRLLEESRLRVGGGMRQTQHGGPIGRQVQRPLDRPHRIPFRTDQEGLHRI